MATLRAGWPTARYSSGRRPNPARDGTASPCRAAPSQALGDIIHWIRYAPLVKQRVGRVLVCCPDSMQMLVVGCAGVDGITSAPIQATAQCPLSSLPYVMGTRLETIPANVPYLCAQSALVEAWREKLPDGFRVGIAWQGSRAYGLDALRSIPLAAFAPLAEVPGVRLISLQHGEGVEQIAAAGLNVTELPGLDQSFGAFMDTAAVMKSLDLVICCESAVAVLAGALGVPVWQAPAMSCDWRWLLNRDDSPWYPTMRLFRQQRLGEWGPVFDRMAEALRER